MIKELIFEEIRSIREEYLNVKKCQHTFFIFEITATGAILSYLLPILLNHPERQTIFHLFLVFAPVIVIMPSMFIIYDKGITLNRIAGFLMVIEFTISQHNRMPKKLEGWERGCREFRRRSGELEPAGRAGTQRPNKFYSLVFWISVILIAICIILFIGLYFRTDFKKPEDISVKALHCIITLIIIFSIFVLIYFAYRNWTRLQEKENTILSMANLWWKIIEDENITPFT